MIGGTLPRDAAPTDARGSADTQVAGNPWLVAVGQAIEGRGEMVYGFALSQMLP